MKTNVINIADFGDNSLTGFFATHLLDKGERLRLTGRVFINVKVGVDQCIHDDISYCRKVGYIDKTSIVEVSPYLAR